MEIWKTQQWPHDWKRSIFIPIAKRCNAKECSNYCTIELISHASKVMLKILQARLQQYVNCELPDVQAGFILLLFLFFFTCSFCDFFFSFIFISWKLITLQSCSVFCHTLTWIGQGSTCIPHPDPPSHLPLHPIALGLPSAPGPSTCLMHPTWAGDLFHYR